jgi:hypothetical protein
MAAATVSGEPTERRRVAGGSGRRRERHEQTPVEDVAPAGGREQALRSDAPFHRVAHQHAAARAPLLHLGEDAVAARQSGGVGLGQDRGCGAC